MTDQRQGSQLAQAQAAMAEQRGRDWAFPVITGTGTALIGCEISRLGLAIAPKLRGIIPRIDWLARTLRAGGGSVFWSHFSKNAFDGPAGDILGEAQVAQLRKRLGDPSWFEVNEGVQGVEADKMIARPGYSAISPEVLPVMRDAKIETVIIAGAETDGAIDSTARAAASAGMRVIVIGDCCVSSDDSAHTAALVALHRKIADVRPVDEVVAELRRKIAN